VQRGQVEALIFRDPSVGDLVNGDWIEVMKFVPSLTARGDEVGCFQQREMFRNRLAAHGIPRKPGTQLRERLTVVLKEGVQKRPARGIGQGSKYQVVFHTRTIGNHLVACQCRFWPLRARANPGANPHTNPLTGRMERFRGRCAHSGRRTLPGGAVGNYHERNAVLGAFPSLAE